jgi:hypothetical protein
VGVFSALKQNPLTFILGKINSSGVNVYITGFREKKGGIK